jgi:hypothetical protein
VAQYSGCPDSDSDGIPDSADPCPTEFGPQASGGCPDRDNDRVLDRDDACPDQAGDPAMGGCPDADRDAIINSQDACPNQFGPLATGGCPDADGDGIQDSNDTCPNAAGPAEFDGCPDSDGDGLRDNVDECPELAGTAEYNGCQFFDSDLDGINDDVDECPNDAGSEALFGCPELTIPVFDPQIQVIVTQIVNSSNVIWGPSDVPVMVGNQPPPPTENFECRYNVSVGVLITDGDLIFGRNTSPMFILFVVEVDGSPLEIVMQGKLELVANSNADAEGVASFHFGQNVDCLDSNPETADVRVTMLSLNNNVLFDDEYNITYTSVTYFVDDLNEYTLFDFAADKGSYEHLSIPGMTAEEFLEQFGEAYCNKGNAFYCNP